MTKSLFGTDGIRGNLNSLYLRPESITKLGRALGIVVKKQLLQKKPNAREAITIGRDTRASGTYLEQALIAGITSMGVDCELIGIVPTSTLAFITKQTGTSLGVMISASHNPSSDNGLKLFDSSSMKLEEIDETIVESFYFSDLSCYESISHKLGKIVYKTKTETEDEYVAMIKKVFDFSLKDLRIVLDCAHGAASQIAPKIFADYGCVVVVIGASPDGNNINLNCGSEAINTIKNEVVRHKAHVGIAFDGDADRVILVDERGEIIDGDALLALIAIDLNECGLLYKNTLVATVMSSYALERSLSPFGIEVMRSAVGDKYVARSMKNGGFSFGGESSGHLILFPETTTGDGIFSALKFLSILKKRSLPASKLVEFFEKTPQILKNIEVDEKIPLSYLPKTKEIIDQTNRALDKEGRVMFRYSGTENKARLLVEAKNRDDCQEIAQLIANVFDDEMREKTKIVKTAMYKNI